MTTNEDAQAALDRMRGTATPAAPASSSTPPARRPTVGFVPVYFPGTPTAASATPIVLGPGEERQGIDIQVQMVSTARIEGTIVGLDGQPAAGATARLVSNATGSSMSSMFDMGFMLGGGTTTPQGALQLSRSSAWCV